MNKPHTMEYSISGCGRQYHSTLSPALGKMKQADFSEFQVSLVYMCIPDQPELHNETLSLKEKKKIQHYEVDSWFI